MQMFDSAGTRPTQKFLWRRTAVRAEERIGMIARRQVVIGPPLAAGLRRPAFGQDRLAAQHAGLTFATGNCLPRRRRRVRTTTPESPAIIKAMVDGSGAGVRTPKSP